MDDKRNERTVVIKSSFERRPRVSAVRADRIKEGFDHDRISGRGAVLVKEAIVLGRNRNFCMNDPIKEEEEGENS